MALTQKQIATNLAHSNPKAASPEGLLEAILAIEAKLKVTRPKHLAAPVHKAVIVPKPAPVEPVEETP